MRYFMGFLGVMALLVLVIFLIIRGFTGEDTSKQLNLPEFTNTNTEVRVTIDGPINAQQEHRGVRITIGRHQTHIDVLHGYGRTVADTKAYDSTPEAYANFLRALQLKGFTKGNADSDKADERGYCPKGNRYIFEVLDGSQTRQRFWKTSCGEGTFRGDLQDVLSLFRTQIPDYSQFTREVDL